jgi:hypothetical protein
MHKNEVFRKLILYFIGRSPTVAMPEDIMRNGRLRQKNYQKVLVDILKVDNFT